MTNTPNRIRELRQKRGLTLQQLAEASGTSKSQIDKLEKSERRLTVDWMIRIAKPLECDPRNLISHQTETAPENSLPIKSTTHDNETQETFISDTIIDQIPRPHYLAHAKDAYAIYVTEDSMTPMYRPRQLLFINPYKPPVPGNGVAVIKTNGAILIREFVNQTPGELILREYHPSKRDISLPNTQVSNIHAIVGSTEPT